MAKRNNIPNMNICIIFLINSEDCTTSQEIQIGDPRQLPRRTGEAGTNVDMGRLLWDNCIDRWSD